MKKTDAHAFLVQFCNDQLKTMPQSHQVAIGRMLQEALNALVPIPDATLEPAKDADHG